MYNMDDDMDSQKSYQVKKLRKKWTALKVVYTKLLLYDFGQSKIRKSKSGTRVPLFGMNRKSGAARYHVKIYEMCIADTYTLCRPNTLKNKRFDRP
uniref:Uncharacterized protein n=1 Tax=Romanomermis culicivorax TaxID=13658 RepID=A0A915KAZ4_ROMCU